MKNFCDAHKRPFDDAEDFRQQPDHKPDKRRQKNQKNNRVMKRGVKTEGNRDVLENRGTPVKENLGSYSFDLHEQL